MRSRFSYFRSVKRRTASVCTAILLLGFFVCGQWLAFSHYHPQKYTGTKSIQIVTEKCQVCDQLISFGAVLSPEQFSVTLESVQFDWLEPVLPHTFSVSSGGCSRAPPLA